MCHQDSLEEEGSNLKDDVRDQDELGVAVSEKKKLGTAVHGLLFRLQVRLMPINRQSLSEPVFAVPWYTSQCEIVGLSLYGALWPRRLLFCLVRIIP